MFGHGTPADRTAAQRRGQEVRRDTRRMERAGQISAALGAQRRLAAEVAVSDAYHPGYKVPESGGRSAFQGFGSSGGVQPPPPMHNRPW